MAALKILGAAAALALLAGCETTAGAAQTATAEIDAFLQPVRVTPASPGEFTAYCDQGLALATRVRTALEGRAGAATLGHDFQTFDDLYNLAGSLGSDASLVTETNPNAEIRAAAEACVQRVSEFSTQLGLSRPIYDRLVAIDASSADVSTRYILDRRLASYRRAGVDRDEATRARVEALQNQITELGLAFARNIRDDASEVTFDSAVALEGLPADYIAAHPPGADGLIHITTNYPDVYPVLSYARRETTRRRVWQAFRDRAHPENDPVLSNILARRHELARTLGFANYAALITQDKMIQNPERAAAFIDQLAGAARPSAERDYQRALARLRRDNPSTNAVQLWSVAYAQQLIRREEYNVDPQVVRTYFSYNNVRDGIFGLVQEMFGIEIRPWNTPVWDPSVQAFEMVENGRVIGRFYLDMHPRDGKFSHAANFPIRGGIDGRIVPVGALICNFPEGLMEHGDVETFLHEFGHMLHGMFSGRQHWAQGNYGEIEWDFIEAPSQLLEEWVWDYDTLSRFARNAEGQTIPRELVQGMRAARTFGEGEATLVQLGYAAVSLNYYARNPEGLNLADEYRRQYGRYSLYTIPADVHPYASFGHLDGYSAIYYTYQWSQAIAVDLFSVFDAAGMRDQATFRRYREQVLAPGGGASANTLIRNFLGRDTTVDAYARRLREG